MVLKSVLRNRFFFFFFTCGCGMTQNEAVHAQIGWMHGTCCTSHSEGSEARTEITSSPDSKIINSLFWPVSISAGLYSSMRLEEKKKSTSIVAIHKWRRFSSTFPLPVKKCCFLASFELKIRIFFPLVFSGRAPFFQRNNGNSGAPRRCATVGDLPDCFGHLWISSIKMTAVFHKNAEFGAGTERAR